MLDGELRVFRAIFSYCDVIIDVGARYDVDYVEISKGNGIKYYLFEINPVFFKRLQKKLRKYAMNEDIQAENIGLSDHKGEFFYFYDSQSVLDTTSTKGVTKRSRKKWPVTSLSSYFDEKSIASIGFLKTDIEGLDYFALSGLKKYVSKSTFIQFELGVGAPLSGRVVTNRDYFLLLEDFYDLYLIKDEKIQYGI